MDPSREQAGQNTAEGPSNAQRGYQAEGNRSQLEEARSQGGESRPALATLPSPPPMVRKFLRGGDGWSPKSIEQPLTPKKGFYFFYGSLMDPSTLQAVLQSQERPVLQPAKIIGYKIMLWGQYPVLVDGKPGTVVKGMGYETNYVGAEAKAEMEKRLQAYETNKYRTAGCLIELEGRVRDPVRGKTFKWAGDIKELREGVFDLRDWQMAGLESTLS
jgi:gamma-glutamylcyclotransferase (GGCT)/AIG2-like uncharacterized protein YtfP